MLWRQRARSYANDRRVQRKPFDQRRTDEGGFDPAIPELALRPCAVAEADDALPTASRGKRGQHTYGLRRFGTASQNLRKSPKYIDVVSKKTMSSSVKRSRVDMKSAFSTESLLRPSQAIAR
jgi:hypothetical protein